MDPSEGLKLNAIASLPDGGSSSLPEMIIGCENRHFGGYGGVRDVYFSDQGQETLDSRYIAKVSHDHWKPEKIVEYFGVSPEKVTIDASSAEAVYNDYLNFQYKTERTANDNDWPNIRFVKGALLHMLLSHVQIQSSSLAIPRAHRFGFVEEVPGRYSPVLVMDKCGEGQTLYHDMYHNEFSGLTPEAYRKRMASRLSSLHRVAATIDTLHQLHTHPLFSKMPGTINAPLVHRDIKPGNILLDNNRDPLLSDFDLARFNGVTQQVHVIRGNLENCSPEQATSNTITTASDQYQYMSTIAAYISGDMIPTQRGVGIDYNNLPLETLIASAQKRECSELKPDYTELIKRKLALEDEEALTITAVLNIGLSFDPGNRYLNCKVPHILVSEIIAASTEDESRFAVALAKYALSANAANRHQLHQAAMGQEFRIKQIAESLWLNPEVGNPLDAIAGLISLRYNGTRR